MSRKTEDFEKSYYAAERFAPLLRELGIPVIMLRDPANAGRGYDDRPVPHVPFWAVRVVNWMGLSVAEIETALRRLAAEPALRATVRGLVQVMRTDTVTVALQSTSFMRDREGRFPTEMFAQVWTNDRNIGEWEVHYDRTGAILKIGPRSRAGGEIVPMPLHIAVVVQQAIEEFVRGDAVMHALGAS